MSEGEGDVIDAYVHRAIAALVSTAELETFSEQFASRRRWDRAGPWYRFGHALGSIACHRGSPPGLLERWAVRDAVAAVDDDFLPAIANAEASFWQVVREAVQARRAAA